MLMYTSKELYCRIANKSTLNEIVVKLLKDKDRSLYKAKEKRLTTYSGNSYE